MNRPDADEVLSIDRTDPFLSVGRWALRVGVCRQTVRNWIRAGRLRHIVTPLGHYRIPASEADRILAEK